MKMGRGILIVVLLLLVAIGSAGVFDQYSPYEPDPNSLISGLIGDDSPTYSPDIILPYVSAIHVHPGIVKPSPDYLSFLSNNSQVTRLVPPGVSVPLSGSDSLITWTGNAIGEFSKENIDRIFSAPIHRGWMREEVLYDLNTTACGNCGGAIYL
jgi:hypothetical protein